MPWFSAVVDENIVALGPTEALLTAVQDRREGPQMRGICKAKAHNGAEDELSFGRPYRSYLVELTAARTAHDELTERLTSGTDLTLV